MAHFGEFLTKGGALEIIRRIRGIKVPMEKMGQVLKDLVPIVAGHGKRIEVNKRAIRVLDIELLERDYLIWKRIRELEELGLGGSLDDYLKKTEAEETYFTKTEAEGKQDKLTAGTGIEITEENVINCTAEAEIEPISPEEIEALFPEYMAMD